MAFEELVCMLIYPVSLMLVIGFRIACAQQKIDPQCSRKVAQASLWGEYSDARNAQDKNQIVIASVRSGALTGPREADETRTFSRYHG